MGPTTYNCSCKNRQVSSLFALKYQYELFVLITRSKAILPHGSAGVSSQLSQKRRADSTLNDKDPRRKRRV